MIVGVPKETVSGERRVALVPELVPKLINAGVDVVVQSGAGVEAGFLDLAYAEKGACLEPEVFDKADILLKVQPPTINEISRMNEGSTLISFLRPYSADGTIEALAARKVTAFSMELIRVSRGPSRWMLSAP